MTRRAAILIASSKFPDEPGLSPLDAPERDIDALRDVLVVEKGGVYDEVVLLKNQPTQKVRLQLNRTLRGSGKDDQVLIYFSGHGKLDPTGRLCLTMTDTVLDALESSALRVAELRDFLDVSRCKSVMLFLDCCYSGAVGKSFARSSVDDQLQVTAEGAGICIMSASNAVQTAMETPEQGLGVFTRCVVDGIVSGAADMDDDGRVTFDELYDYVHKKVTAEGHQRPQKWSFQAEGDLLVAYNRRDLWKETKQKLRAKVLALAESQDLPDDVVGVALELLNVPRREQSEKQRMQVKLIEELADGSAKPATFAVAFLKLAAREPVRAAPAPPPEKTPNSPAATRVAAPAVLASPAATIKIAAGRWLIEPTQYGVVPVGKYTLDLHADGSLVGSGSFLGTVISVQGHWRFQSTDNVLRLDLKTRGILGLPANETMKISITGREGDRLKGHQWSTLRAFTLTPLAQP